MRVVLNLTVLLLVSLCGDVSQLCLHHNSQPPLLLISRLDGKISAIQLSESLPVLWEVDLGYPLLSSTNVVLEDNTFLIPSLDGNLYSLSNKMILQPYAQLEMLLSKPSEPGTNSRWVGGKVITTRGVSPTDGRILYQCNIDNCKRYNDSTVGNEPMLAVTDEKRTVRLLDMKHGVERWNWSISTVEMQYIGVKHRSSCLPPHLPVNLNFDVEQGLITALFDTGHFATVDLPGPLSQAWVLNDEYLQSINMFYNDKTDPMAVNIYMGLWQGNHYIQPFHPHESLFSLGRINREVFELGWTLDGRDTISWQHPSYEEMSDTALATITTDKVSTDVAGKVWKPNYDYIPPPYPSITAHDTTAEVWDSVYDMLATILFGIIIAYGVYRKVFKKKPKLSTTSTETEEKQTLSAPASPVGQNNGFSFDNTPPQQFESRFEQDFIVIRELGEGGFGKVIEAKHKISEHNYAIKIIKLPYKEELKKKVEREVAAMAKLEHPNILRYYTSWKETPTLEWARSRAYTFTSESVDSGTSIRSSSTSFSWSKIEGNSRNKIQYKLKMDDDSTSVGIRNKDDTYSDIVFQHESKRSGEGDSSIVFAEDYNLTPRERLHVSLGIPDSAAGDETFSDSRNSESETPLAVGTHESFLYIQMQLCSDATLKEWLTDNKERQGIMRIFSEIVDAVEYIHSHNHIHRDLKPSNILFGEDGRVKVADFGLATVMSNLVHSPDPGIDLPPGFEGPSMTQNLGTKLYMSPELETDSHYDYKVDIFALGIILFELLEVFDTAMERVELIQNLRRERRVPDYLDTHFPKYKVILLQMIAHHPADRPTASEVKTFFSNSDCDQIYFSRQESVFR